MAQQAVKIQPIPKLSVQQADMRIVIVGHVDHGKSTLVGRLLYETDSLPDGRFEQISKSCEKRGMPFEWAFLMDALQAERDQNITIETTQIWFKTATRRYCLIDAPGHQEFLKNMMTGAAMADAALLLVDAKEGIKEQTRRHAGLLKLFGIRQIIVLVNKMDQCDFSEARFEEVKQHIEKMFAELGLEAQAILPLSAYLGEGITSYQQIGWYALPPLLAQLDALSPKLTAEDAPLRFSVQDIYRFDARRIIAGRIESGQLQAGDKLVFSPGNVMAEVRSIEHWSTNNQSPIDCATRGQSIGIVLKDQIFVERGHIASHAQSLPCLTNHLRMRLFWMGREPLTVGQRLRMKISTASHQVTVATIHQVVDSATLEQVGNERILPLQTAEISLQIRGFAVVDDPAIVPALGRCVLFDNYQLVGGGLIDTDALEDMRPKSQMARKSTHVSTVDYDITRDHRAQQNGHRGGILWFTGLSGSGKSTLAKELQKRLFDKGYHVYVLDGDNIRQGLCADLAFSPEDRSENIRRIGEVANLFADAGVIVITAFISPYRDDRRRAQMIAADGFHTIYIKADVETCENRDVKGLYQKARRGEIIEFTGVSAPYEEPLHPDLVVDTASHSIGECVEQLIRYVDTNFVKKAAF